MLFTKTPLFIGLALFVAGSVCSTFPDLDNSLVAVANAAVILDASLGLVTETNLQTGPLTKDIDDVKRAIAAATVVVQSAPDATEDQGHTVLALTKNAVKVLLHILSTIESKSSVWVKTGTLKLVLGVVQDLQVSTLALAAKLVAWAPPDQRMDALVLKNQVAVAFSECITKLSMPA